MRQKLETGANILMVLVALTMLGFYMADRQASPTGGVGFMVEDWREHNEAGIRVGPSDAPIVLTEFIDFTCPHCKTLSVTVDSLRRRFPNDVAVVFMHFPLAGRPYSSELAIAAECGHEQDRFWEVQKAIFALEPGERSREGVLRIAERVRISDPESFAECLDRPLESFPRIGEGRRIGEAEGVTGTPALWINGRVDAARGFNEIVFAAGEHGVNLR